MPAIRFPLSSAAIASTSRRHGIAARRPASSFQFREIYEPRRGRDRNDDLVDAAPAKPAAAAPAPREVLPSAIVPPASKTSIQPVASASPPTTVALAASTTREVAPSPAPIEPTKTPPMPPAPITPPATGSIIVMPAPVAPPIQTPLVPTPVTPCAPAPAFKTSREEYDPAPTP